MASALALPFSPFSPPTATMQASPYSQSAVGLQPSGLPSLTHAPNQEVRKIVEKKGTKLEYSLHVEQQPDRARMCGFGDKDRRPITPPPCIKLIVTDVLTGRQLSVK